MMFLLGYGHWLLSLASFVLFPKGHACPDAKETVPPNLGQSWDPFLGPQKWNITEMVKPYPAKGSYIILVCRVAKGRAHGICAGYGPCLYISAASPKRVTGTQGCGHILHHFRMKQISWYKWHPGWIASGVHVPTWALLQPALCLSSFSVLTTKARGQTGHPLHPLIHEWFSLLVRTENS